MDEAVIFAHKLASRIGDELSIPVYCYEKAAFIAERKNLANCRSGEYEGLSKKLSDIRWKPDFGPATFNKQSGATIVGARDFLVAYNINLDTTSVELANAIACDVREKGQPNTKLPGSLKAVKAMGWFIKEYGKAQVSMNLTDISITPVHIAFEEVCRQAEKRGIKVTGSELIGLIPLKSLLDAGRYFLNKQKRSTDVSDDELIDAAIESLGLNDVKPFNPDEKIIEYVMVRKGN
jgi:glutamate formiminotransferase/formiminotetrahydrofolate cyclodeaminase